MDINKYRKKLQDEISSEAGTRIPAKDAVKILQDKSSSAASRIEAIDTFDAYADQFDTQAKQLLLTLADKAEAVSVRLAAINGLKAMAFLGPKFAAYEADYHQTLRGVIQDKSKNIRKAAIEILAVSNDTDIKDRLLAGLKGTQDALVPEELAIEFLGYDEHSDAIETVKEIFDDLKTAGKEQAIRILSTDVGSTEMLTKLIKNRSEKSALRCLSAVGLKNANPEAFDILAKEIISDNADYNEIRATCLSALTAGKSRLKSETKDEISELASKIKTSSRNLKKATKNFLSKLR